MKTVKPSYTITRNGKKERVSLGDVPYGRFVALEAALAAALVGLLVPGVIDLAAADPNSGVAKTQPTGGDDDIAIELETDHGKGGSRFSIAYRGISADGADMVESVMRRAVESVGL